MADFVPFVPSAERTAAWNMDEFVRSCREDLTMFGAGLCFDDPVWDVSAFYPCPSGPSSERIHFNKFSPSKGNAQGPPFGEPFGAQARAYIRYEAGRRRSKKQPSLDLYALRAIAAALDRLSAEPDLLLVDQHVLDAAFEVARSRYATAVVMQIGQKLGAIADFLRRNSLSAVAPLDWRHGITHAVIHSSRIGPEADARRTAKLPSEEVLHAVGDAFRAATETGDIILTSIVALLCCAPDRINEVLRLEVDCEVAPLSDNEPGYMLRWPGSKGFRDGVKGIPDLMAPVAKEAIKRLRQQTHEARLIAAWYEANPGSLYLPDDCTHLRGQDLLTSDAMRIVGFPSRGARTSSWLGPASSRSSAARRAAGSQSTDIASRTWRSPS